MNEEEFKLYLIDHGDAISEFRERAKDYQLANNERRPRSKRWDRKAIDSAVEGMVDQFVDGVYRRIQENVKESKFHPRDSWITFIEKYEVLDELEDSISDLEFD